MVLRILLALLAITQLAACAGPAEPKWASNEAVSRARFSTGERPSLTLFTVISNSNGSGGHAALMVNADERVLFDPAGTWHHPHLPERNDVHFGMSDAMVDFYIDYHTRKNWHVRTHKIYVTPEIAAIAKREVLAYGAVPKAQCTVSVGRILDKVPGMSGAPNTYFPKRMMDYWATLPGVETAKYVEDKPGNTGGRLIAPPAAHMVRN